MNSATVKILGFFISLFIIVNVGSQIYFALYNPYSYETAIRYTLEDTLDFNAVLVRDEDLVEYGGNGVISYSHPDGNKVSAGSVIAEVFASADEITRQKRIAQLENEVSILQASQEAGATDPTQLDTVSKQIDEIYSQLITQLSSDSFSLAIDTKSSLLTLFNRMQIITGKSGGYDAHITDLQSQILILGALSSTFPTPITTEHSGYFVSYYDGYEDKLSTDMVEELSISDINEIVENFQARESPGIIGKIISDYDWKLVGVIDAGLETSFIEGTKVNVKVGSSSGFIPATVDKVKLFPEEQKALIVLSCDRIQYDLVLQRTDKVKLLLDTYTGIRVSSSAIRYNDAGEKGVYIKLGQTIHFRKIDVVYDGEDFKIVKDLGTKGYLAMYDEIVVEGKDLYDNKPVK